MAKKPLIGILLDHAPEGSFSDLPHYALREHYFKAVEKAGGIPVGLAYTDNPEDYLDTIDGLLSPGGTFAYPEDWYEGENTTSPYEASERLEHDIQIIKGALDRDMPVLGICAGMQIMSVVTGGKLIPDLTAHFSDAADHLHSPKSERAHEIKVSANTVLRSIIGEEDLSVNSWHREAVVSTGKDVAVSARSATDDVVEAIEVTDKAFALGVQWHPEVQIAEDDGSEKLFVAFVSKASDYASMKLGR